MRARTIVALIALLIVIATAYNLFFSGLHISRTGRVLPGSQFEREREKLLRVPFQDRPHRLERQPRLERDNGMR